MGRRIDDLLLLPAAVVTMTATVLAVRLLPARAWRSVARLSQRAVHRDRPGGRTTPEAVVAAVSRAGRLVPGGANCLVRALTGRALMSAAGVPSEVVLGVRKTPDGQLKAHAWLRCRGAIVMGGGAPDPFVPLPDPGTRL